uniref:Ig-like domain-containing protein n=1 Tax=Mola mola TaxID=94237 RepID=A0A3Q4BN42_MOLML
MEKRKEKPVFLRELSTATVTVGQSATFTIKVSGFPKPVAQWFHNGQTITSSSVYIFRQERDEYSLIISRVERELEGDYSCTVSNRFGQSTCTSHLHVFVKEPEMEQRVERRMFLFQIQPTVFCIISVKQEQSGIYTCKASNQHGESSCTAELLIFRPESQEEITKGLRISLTEQTTESRLVQEKTLSDRIIYAISTEDRQIIPSEEAETLRELDVYAATLQQDEKFRIFNRFNTSCLEILNPTKDDSGEYTCKATNQHGSDECSASLNVTGKSEAFLPPFCLLSLKLLLVG